MDESKLPYKFSPDPDLVGIKPLIISPLNKGQDEEHMDAITGHLAALIGELA
ncbi:hypothetical protein JHK85_022225 [Glycine max]|nr:hypothetical protein JHK85_022225 [Glycine max]